ncbi:MAG: sulfate ABC transporter permease subunit CysW [Deltaproteobacteria bacterium]|nr:sulfate ABC transporter permease subunit CysW [Deltaproteobacteria bacterium]
MKAGAITAGAAAPGRRAQQEPRWIQLTIVALAILILGVLVIIPMVDVFYEALRHGFGAYWTALTGDHDTLSAILLTLRVAPVAVLFNTLFGVAAAWVIARFRFPGRTLLTSLIDLPFAVSPVVAGLIFVLIFGLQGYLGQWLRDHDLKVIFATPGLILATSFVTFPFVARELIPLMEAIGAEEEIAAVSLGARAWYLFRRITLPNIKWGLLYGIILCNARAMGEFGAVYVVSGHITGQTDTMPLRVEKLFQEYNNVGSFAVASLLSFLALVTLSIKTALEWQTRRDLRNRLREAQDEPLAAPRSAGRLLVEHPEPERRERGVQQETTRVGIEVRNVTKRFGDFAALSNVSLDVPDGALLALLGPSGSGKTTLLRIISGLDLPDEGTIHYQDEDTTNRSPRDRNVGFVFQHYALFRHMTVFENVAFGLRVRKWPKAKVDERVHQLLSLVQLDSLGKQMPSQLSGGQRQRIALARALAADPQVLLLDEPFGALDAKVRQELRQWLRKLHDEIHVTSVFVTHDQEEAFEVADRVVVMNRGRIEQAGTPSEVFEHPANAFVMDFLGNVNVFHGRVEGGRARVGSFEVAYPSDSPTEGQAVKAYVRPHELEIDRLPRDDSSLKAVVQRINSAAAAVKVELFSADFGLPLLVDLTRERYDDLHLQQGDVVFVFPKRVRVFAEDYQI